MLAAQFGHFECVELLVQSKAALDVQDEVCCSPHSAVFIVDS